MAYPDSNQKGLKDVHWHTADAEGREFNARYTLSEVKFPNAWGDKFSLLEILNGVERRVAEQNAITKSLVSALASVAGGQSFDEAKLLAGVREQARLGSQEGLKDVIESIDTVVTIK